MWFHLQPNMVALSVNNCQVTLPWGSRTSDSSPLADLLCSIDFHSCTCFQLLLHNFLKRHVKLLSDTLWLPTWARKSDYGVLFHSSSTVKNVQYILYTFPCCTAFQIHKYTRQAAKLLFATISPDIQPTINLYSNKYLSRRKIINTCLLIVIVSNEFFFCVYIITGIILVHQGCSVTGTNSHERMCCFIISSSGFISFS